jgi:sialic acid synthase SpsE
MHLRRIPHLAETFDVVPGLSDHTLGTEVPMAGVALGTRIVEKHLTLSRDEEGPDSDFSLEPDEFAEMVQAVRKTEKALGEVRYETTENGLCYGVRHVRVTGRLLPSGENITSVAPNSIWSLPEDGRSLPVQSDGSQIKACTRPLSVFGTTK